MYMQTQLNVNQLRSKLSEPLDQILGVPGGDVYASGGLNKLLNSTDTLAQQRDSQCISYGLFVLAVGALLSIWCMLQHHPKIRS